MATPIALTKVNILGNRYYSIIDNVKTEITESQYNAPQQANETRSINIKFDTPSGDLSDNQYATQANGHHWVKIPGYKVIKIDPILVSKGKVTSDGITKILKDSEAE